MHPTSHPRTPRRIALRGLMSVAVAASLTLTANATGQAATTDPNPNAMELAHAALSRSAATQGMVLLENDNKALPIPSKGNVAVFGVGAYKTVKGGTGSGAVNNRYTISVRQGLENAGYTITTNSAYWGAMTAAYDAKYPDTGSPFGGDVDYSSVEQLLTSASVQPTAATDTAIYVLARNSGEGADRKATKGDYLLSDTERADISMIGAAYRRVVVVLNTGGIVDTTWFGQINQEVTKHKDQALDALLLMSQAGQEAGNAVVDVLKGAVDPSGKLTDTWASQYSYYPASATFANNDGKPLSERYSEGVYVGYRYFDSFYKTLNSADPASVVSYPFGYGLSYTRFALRTVSVQADMNWVEAKVKVTNRGHTSGREVVQVYYSAPQTGLDKPYQSLGGYAKTSELKPHRSQVVTIKFRTTEMAAYDTSTATYRMDAGDYLIRVGNSSRGTNVAARVRLARTTVTERLHNEMAAAGITDDLTSSPANFYSYRGESKEIAKARSVKLHARGFVAPDNASAFQQNVQLPNTSALYPVSGSPASSITAYVSRNRPDWEGTGAQYEARDGETLKLVTTDPGNTLYDVYTGKVTLKEFVAGLSVDQLSHLVEGGYQVGSTESAGGAAGYTTTTLENKGVPAMILADGPAGLRITQKTTTNGVTTYQWCTAWPIGTLLAQSWDADLVATVGKAIGDEMAYYKVTLWLAPGMNIHRDPLNGRNFEYYSEDPLVTGATASSITLGVQSVPGVGVTVKHFAANNQETNRFTTDAVVSERALREIYLKGFEIAVKSAQPMAVMSSYNLINGHYTPATYDLLTDILRGEWGFRGLVMSDWTSIDYAGEAPAQYAGNDLIEPGGKALLVAALVKKVEPVMDVSGLPAYEQNVIMSWGGVSLYTLMTGSWTLSATGADTITTRVDSATDLTAVKSVVNTVDMINNVTSVPHPPFASVDDAYQEVHRFLTSTGFGSPLTDAQKAAIKLSDVVTDASGKVTAYTVTLTGSYPASGYPLRLGDLQRSAMHILNLALQTETFNDLATLQSVSGVSVQPYSSQYELHPYLVTKSSHPGKTR